MFDTKVVLLCLMFATFSRVRCRVTTGPTTTEDVGQEAIYDEGIRNVGDGHREFATDEERQPSNTLDDRLSQMQATISELEIKLKEHIENDEPLTVSSAVHRRSVPDVNEPTNSSPIIAAEGSRSISRPLWPPYYPVASGPCLLCPAGIQGPRGPPGPAGMAGRDGRDGRDAPFIEPGKANSPPDVVDTTTPESQSETPIPSGANSMYVRWGRFSCPDTAQLIYDGVVGGTFYTDVGGGANRLCLPPIPVYDQVVPGVQTGARAGVYGAEYETSGGGGLLADIHDHSPPCAVCLAPRRSVVLMIPARNDCPSGAWTLEYTGYLMTSHHSHKRTEFICVDGEPEVIENTHGNLNGPLLYLTEGRCLVGGGLPCNPYIDGNELTCAVCTM